MSAIPQAGSPVVAVVRLPHAEGLPLPAYETADAAGMDLRAAVPEDAPIVLKPLAREAVPTGLTMAIPPGFEGQVRPRSGLALKSGVTCLNTPGTIDADYRGEVKVILINLGAEDFTIRRGDRIAQLLISPVSQAVWREASSLDEAIEIIHASRYGNAASLFTQNGRWARHFKYTVRCGNLGINIGVAAPIAMFHFAGMKQSFFGVLHGQGKDAFQFFTEGTVVVERWFD